MDYFASLLHMVSSGLSRLGSLHIQDGTLDGWQWGAGSWEVSQDCWAGTSLPSSRLLRLLHGMLVAVFTELMSQEPGESMSPSMT